MKQNYDKPRIEVIEIAVEQGFAATNPPEEGEYKPTEPSNFKDFDVDNIDDW